MEMQKTTFQEEVLIENTYESAPMVNEIF